jgi:hypothetical protein
MKKKIIYLFVIIMLTEPFLPCFAVNIGSYKTETEYGLLDGFKFNWKKKDKNTPFIEVREESTSQEKNRDLKNYKESEYERTKYMYDGKAII